MMAAATTVTDPRKCESSACIDCTKPLPEQVSVWCIVVFGKKHLGTKDVRICEDCEHESEMAGTSRCCRCGHREPNVKLEITNFCDFDDDMHTYMCTDCRAVERQGKCSTGIKTPGWDGSLVTTRKCTRKEVYPDPPCCGKDVFCQGTCYTSGCTHPNHPSYLYNLDGKYLCVSCFDDEFEKREQGN